MYQSYHELVKETIATLNGDDYVAEQIECGTEVLMTFVANYLEQNEYPLDVQFEDKDEEGNYKFDRYAQYIMGLFSLLKFVHDDLEIELA